MIGSIHGSRNGKQCRDRWTQYLDPNLVKTKFTDQDRDTIIEALEQGQKWSYLAGVMPGRSANDIKNFYNTHIKKKRKGGTSCTSSELEIIYSDANPTPALEAPDTPQTKRRAVEEPFATVEQDYAPATDTMPAAQPSANLFSENVLSELVALKTEDIVLPPLSIGFLSPAPPDRRPAATAIAANSQLPLLPTSSTAKPDHHVQGAAAVVSQHFAAPTNLQTRFDSVAEIQYEQGVPMTMDSNLSFFFCDEEFEPLNTSLLQHLPVAPDISFG